MTRMTREEFRQYMLRKGNQKQASDMLVDCCIALQLELHEPDCERILCMNTGSFDLMLEALTQRKKEMERSSKREVRSFGLVG